jgi:hypothetical protein
MQICEFNVINFGNNQSTNTNGGVSAGFVQGGLPVQAPNLQKCKT